MCSHNPPSPSVRNGQGSGIVLSYRSSWVSRRECRAGSMADHRQRVDRDILTRGIRLAFGIPRGEERIQKSVQTCRSGALPRRPDRGSCGNIRDRCNDRQVMVTHALGDCRTRCMRHFLCAVVLQQRNVEGPFIATACGNEYRRPSPVHDGVLGDVHLRSRACSKRPLRDCLRFIGARFDKQSLAEKTRRQTLEPIKNRGR